jgi:mRNA-degrading endonuclease HigB of HigAB toxin-antitoxin module
MPAIRGSRLPGRNTKLGDARWRNPEDVKAAYPKASVLKGSRIVFNIKGNDYR